MKVFSLLSLLLLFSSLFLSTAEHIQYSIRRGQTPARGVNLGGWLVLEHWMSADSPIWKNVPGNIADQGEMATMRHLGHGADSLIEQHRKTWITEGDIAEIAKFGLNLVRVPVGYWILGYDNSGSQDWKTFTPGGLKYLDTLIRDWCKKYNIAVLVSIHAAKGSQNGNDHSAPPDAHKTYWSQYPENVASTIDFAEFLAARYKNDEAFLGLGLLNEPGGSTDENILKKYYIDAYNRVRKISDCVLTHMPFLWQQTNQWYSDFTPGPTFSNVWHEWHKYLLWGYEQYDANGIRGVARGQLTNEMRDWKGNWLLTGEWSLATADKARFNNDDDYRAYAKEYIGALNIGHSGWVYWSWKMSGDEGNWNQPWSMRNMLRRRIIQL